MAHTPTTRFFTFIGADGIGGGLVSENAIAVSKNQMVIADNILIGTTISRRKRGGQSKYHTGTFDLTASYPASGVPIRGVLDYWRTASMAGNPVQDVFLHQGTKVWSIDDRNTVGVDRTGALTISSSAVPSYQVFNQKIYFCSTETSDGYNKWDGTSSSSVAATPPPDGVGKYLCSHLGRMVMAGNNDFPFRVYLSSSLEPENWSTISPSDSTSLDLDDDGDPEGITGIASFQNRLYVWTRRTIYEITGNSPSEFVVQRISNGIGSIAHASIVQIPNDIVFASDRGVHSLRQMNSGRQSETTFLSRDIQKLWTELLNTALYKRCMATYDETINCYIISVPSSGQSKNDQLLVYNIEFGTWTVWPSIDARSITTILLGNKKNILIGKENGVLALLNQSARNDFGSGYTARFKTGVLQLGNPSYQKRFKSITVFASTTTQSSFSIGWEIDGKKTGSRAIDLTAGEGLLGTTFVLGSSKLGVGQYVPNTVPIDETGWYIQVEITAGGNSDLEIYGFILEAEETSDVYK